MKDLFFVFLFSLFFLTNINSQEGAIGDSIPVTDTISASQIIPIEVPSNDFYFKIWDNSNIKYFSLDKSLIKNKTLVLKIDSTEKFTYPLRPNGRFLSKFGPRRGRMHTGCDIKCCLNDTIVAMFDGKVRIAKRISGYGNMVLIRHNNGLETLYAHLNSIKVKVNDDVRSGDLIGLGGRTGRATTEHLHFETRILGIPFDSEKYIDFCEGKLIKRELYFLNDQIEISPDNFNNFHEPIQESFEDESCFDKEVSNVGNQYVYVEIKKGDTLYKLAKKYHTTVSSIMELNKMKNGSKLSVGQTIIIK